MFGTEPFSVYLPRDAGRLGFSKGQISTKITMNPVAVNIQCHSARRANAIITPGGISFV